MAEIQDGHHFKARRNIQSADFAGTSDRIGSGPDANRRSSRGRILPIFKMAEIQDGHHFKARRISSRPISQEPAIGSARDRMQIEGRAEGEFHQFSKWPKSKMATTLRLAEIPVGRFRRNQRSDRLGTGCKSKVEPRGNFTNFQNGRNPRWPPL